MAREPTIEAATVGEGFEERADHVAEEELLRVTVTEEYFDKVHKELVSRGLVLIQGPRGCGKTHMMRYSTLQCRDNSQLPLALYVSFNRYLRLEPLLHSRPDAVPLFQAWVLGRIVHAAQELSTYLKPEFNVSNFLKVEMSDLEELVSRLERNLGLTAKDEVAARSLTIDGVAKLIIAICVHYGRKRAVLMLDDAALTLTPEYMIEFFDIVRALKRPTLSPKASVYPGSTEYGPRFHVSHEARVVPVWLPVEHLHYQALMADIARQRYPESSDIPPHVNTYLMYAAFGVPRAYLTMLREWRAGGFSTEQQGLNRVVQSHTESRRQEYLSLALKIPRFNTIIRTGEKLFDGIVEALKKTNDELFFRKEKQLRFGLEANNLSPLTKRMITLLIEAGLLYEEVEVSHGQDRKYRRFTPHMAALLAARAFSGKSRGMSVRGIIDFLQRPSEKHPIRRKIETVLMQREVENLTLDLPPCQRCKTSRLSEAQKFCHACGTKLVDHSTFSRCMELPFDEVSGLTKWQRNRLREHGLIKVGDLLTLQDPGTELRQIYLVGELRAERIVNAVETYVDEFLT